jgi:hypothetical protein
MTNTTVLITDMAILVVIFLLGTLAKIFPKSGRNADSRQRSDFSHPSAQRTLAGGLDRDQGSVNKP